jgi:hypothetical protein
MTPQDTEPKGWNGMKRTIARLSKELAALRNITLQRSGVADTVSVGQSGVTFNLQSLPKSSTSVGSSSSPGLLIYRAGETDPDYISIADVLEDYDDDDDWSLEFGVTSGKLDDFTTTAPAGVTDTELYDGDASADPVESQTYYRLPVIRTVEIDGDDEITQWPISGIYRENIFCAGSKGAIVELIRIG